MTMRKIFFNAKAFNCIMAINVALLVNGVLNYFLMVKPALRFGSGIPEKIRARHTPIRTY